MMYIFLIMKKEYDIKFLRLNTIFFINNTLNVKYHSKGGHNL